VHNRRQSFGLEHTSNEETAMTMQRILLAAHDRNLHARGAVDETRNAGSEGVSLGDSIVSDVIVLIVKLVAVGATAELATEEHIGYARFA
jgi:hypothetical protein